MGKLLTRRNLLRTAALAAPALLLPSRHIIHPAMGRSHGQPPAIPALAAAAGFNTTTFFDYCTSTGTFDLDNTGDPTKKWSIKNAWPKATLAPSGNGGWANQGVAGGSIVSGADSNPKFFSATAANGLTINDTTAQACAWEAHSARPTGVGSTYQGFTFTGGAYIAMRVAADPTLAVAGMNSWLAGWTVPVEYLTGLATRFGELDIVEYFPQISGSVFTASNIHIWDLGTNPGTVTDFNDGHISPGVTDSSPHLFETVWKTIAQNGGTTGFFKRYFDGVHVASLDLFYTISDIWALFESQNHMLILAAGPSWPTKFVSASQTQPAIQVCQP